MLSWNKIIRKKLLKVKNVLNDSVYEQLSWRHAELLVVGWHGQSPSATTTVLWYKQPSLVTRQQNNTMILQKLPKTWSTNGRHLFKLLRKTDPHVGSHSQCVAAFCLQNNAMTWQCMKCVNNHHTLQHNVLAHALVPVSVHPSVRRRHCITQISIGIQTIINVSYLNWNKGADACWPNWKPDVVADEACSNSHTIMK